MVVAMGRARTSVARQAAYAAHEGRGEARTEEAVATNISTMTQELKDLTSPIRHSTPIGEGATQETRRSSCMEQKSLSSVSPRALQGEARTESNEEASRVREEEQTRAAVWASSRLWQHKAFIKEAAIAAASAVEVAATVGAVCTKEVQILNVAPEVAPTRIMAASIETIMKRSTDTSTQSTRKTPELGRLEVHTKAVLVHRATQGREEAEAADNQRNRINNSGAGTEHHTTNIKDGHKACSRSHKVPACRAEEVASTSHPPVTTWKSRKLKSSTGYASLKTRNRCHS